MCSASFTATIRTMTTPAERASAVAFAWKNCALESLTPNETTANAARSYEHGSVGLEELLAAGDAGQDRGQHRRAYGTAHRQRLVSERGLG
jgi:cell filamentation protein